MIGRNLTPTTKQKLSRLYLDLFEAYRLDVLTGQRPAGKLEIAKIKRHDADLKKGGRWIFDTEKALKPLLWIAANYKYPSGLKRGKAFRPEPWQIFDIMAMFGWVDKDTRRRKYTQVYWEIARKNGKSTLAGAVLDYLAFGDGYPAAMCAIAANSLEQAGECFSRADEGLKLAKHEGYESFNSRTYKIVKWGDAQISALTAAPKDGKLLHGAVLDEYHESKDSAMLDSFLTGNVSDPEALVIVITTAGSNIHGPCHQEYEKCVKILQEGFNSERYFISIYEPDKGDPINSANTWQKANPNWDISVDADMLQTRYDVSAPSAPDLITFKTKNLNMWVHSLTKWANMEKWITQCCGPADVLPGALCYGGLDLSSTSDFTAFCADFPPADYTEIHKQLYMFWIPEENVIKIENQCSIPLRQWIADGYVIATPGPVVDYTLVGKWLSAFREEFDLTLIAGDKHRLIDLARVTDPWFTDATFEFSQGKMTMSPSTQKFENMYLQGKIQSGDNPIMRWMMSCVDSHTDSNANVKLIKPKLDRSAARIDGVISAIMALDTAITQVPDGLTSIDVANAVSFF